MQDIPIQKVDGVWQIIPQSEASIPYALTNTASKTPVDFILSFAIGTTASTLATQITNNAFKITNISLITYGASGTAKIYMSIGNYQLGTSANPITLGIGIAFNRDFNGAPFSISNGTPLIVNGSATASCNGLIVVSGYL